MPQIHCFQLLKCEDFLLYCRIGEYNEYIWVLDLMGNKTSQSDTSPWALGKYNRQFLLFSDITLTK